MSNIRPNRRVPQPPVPQNRQQFDGRGSWGFPDLLVPPLPLTDDFNIGDDSVLGQSFLSEPLHPQFLQQQRHQPPPPPPPSLDESSLFDSFSRDSLGISDPSNLLDPCEMVDGGPSSNFDMSAIGDLETNELLPESLFIPPPPPPHVQQQRPPNFGDQKIAKNIRFKQQVGSTNPLVFNKQTYEELFTRFQKSKKLSRITSNYLLNAKFNVVVNGNKSNFVFELNSQKTTKKLLDILTKRNKLHYDAPLKNIRRDNKCITINSLRALLYFFSKFPKNIRQTFPMGKLLSYRRDIEPQIGKYIKRKEEFIPVINFEQTKNFFSWLNSKPDFDIKVNGLNTRVHPQPPPPPRPNSLNPFQMQWQQQNPIDSTHQVFPNLLELPLPLIDDFGSPLPLPPPPPPSRPISESQSKLSGRKRKRVRSKKDNKRPKKRKTNRCLTLTTVNKMRAEAHAINLKKIFNNGTLLDCKIPSYKLEKAHSCGVYLERLSGDANDARYLTLKKQCEEFPVLVDLLKFIVEDDLSWSAAIKAIRKAENEKTRL